ncbi:P-loop NTPase family protein [Nocardioides dongkuii]|uniref:hypothetical protein n=1 Tax=Nocardioides dongkuii TaxID=2760089 RepID=UPI001877BE7F|nr:hypothetical protein [Nocardioides dongkuii]
MTVCRLLGSAAKVALGENAAAPAGQGAEVQIVLEDVRVQGRRAPLLELDRLAVETGECVLVAGEPGQGHTALALVLTGRMAPSSGRVRLVDDGGSFSYDPRELRRVTAVVDLPGVSEPDDEVPVGTVTAEGLALAHRGAGPRAPGRWLARQHLGELEPDRVDALVGPTRTALLTALAAERVGVRFLVLTLPDRHGDEPAHWWDLSQQYAGAGYGVLVQCNRSSARDLGAALPPAQGVRNQYARPVETLRVRLQAPPEQLELDSPPTRLLPDERPGAAPPREMDR